MMLEHIAIQATDLERSIEFYMSAFGFKVLRKRKTNAYLNLGNDLLEINQSEGFSGVECAPRPARLTWHMGFRVEGIDEEVDRLLKLGATLIEPVRVVRPRDMESTVESDPVEEKLRKAMRPTEKGWRIASLSDPDGTVFELVER